MNRRKVFVLLHTTGTGRVAAHPRTFWSEQEAKAEGEFLFSRQECFWFVAQAVDPIRED